MNFQVGDLILHWFFFDFSAVLCELMPGLGPAGWYGMDPPLWSHRGAEAGLLACHAEASGRWVTEFKMLARGKSIPPSGWWIQGP